MFRAGQQHISMEILQSLDVLPSPSPHSCLTFSPNEVVSFIKLP